MQEFIVSTLEDENDGNHDAGDLSLREAIAIADPGATITFDSSLADGTIDLVLGELAINKDLTIRGLGAKNLTIDGSFVGGEFPYPIVNRVFNINDGNDTKSSNVTIEGITIAGGRSVEVSGGAGILNYENLSLNSSIVRDNVTTGRDGAGISNSGNLVVNSSSIINNRAAYRGGLSGGAFGGGISNGGTARIVNSTIAENYASIGSGGISSSGTLEISNSTITSNTADFSDSEGIADGISGSATITSSIVAGNGIKDFGDFGEGAVLTSGGNNLIGNGDGSTGLSNGVNGDLVGTSENPIDPNLGELQDNGGATPTQELLVGSLAIDAGSNPDGLATDQRGEGFDRTVGDGTDIGAFEVQDGGGGAIPDELVVSTLEDESDGDFSAGDLSLREAIALANEQEGEDTITFDSNLSGGTIALTQTEPARRGGEFNDDFDITDSVNIVNSGAKNITIDGLESGNGIFEITGEKTDVNLEGLTITNGLAARFFFNDAGSGGAIEFYGANLTIKDSAITNSRADFGGAINSSGHVNIIDSTISNNSGPGISTPSGAIDANSLDITNSTISNNPNSAIFADTLNISNSTVTNNDEGISSYGTSSVKITSSIVADNNNIDLFTFKTGDGSPVITSGGNNLIGDRGNVESFTDGVNGDIVGTTDNPVDPNLGELQDNGGATPTQELLAGSPAIDTGSNPDGLATDQRGEGFDRTVGNGTDIGAFEVQDGGGGAIPDELVVSTLEDESDGDFSEGDLSLREAIANSNEEDTITFDSSLSGGTITLNSGELLIDKSLTIDALGANNLTIDANQASRVFNIDDGQDKTNLDVTIDGLTITGGEAAQQNSPGDTNPGNFGGGISNRENLNLNNSHIKGNNAVARGGGIFNAAGALTINNSTISNNSSNSERVGASGGGILNETGVLTISNSTISNNSAFQSGGISSGGATEINNSTISDNKAAVSAGGINATGTITSSIVAGNVNENNNSDTNNNDVSGELISGGNNLIGDRGNLESFADGVNGDIVGTTDNPIDPNLGELQDNGGATPTQELLPGSPAIDTGSNPDGLTTDQRGEGFERTVGKGTDIGAFEVQDGDGETTPDELVVSTLEDESDGDFSEGDLSLREAIALSNENEGEDTITFDSSLSGGTIAFAESQERNLAINDSVSIKGLGQDNLTLDGGFIFNIAADTDVAVDGLNLTGGKIDSFGNLTLTNSTISKTLEIGSVDNSSIISRGTTIISDSTIKDNNGGGNVGIVVESGTATISDSTVANNQADYAQAGIMVRSNATLNLSNSTVSNNKARSVAGIDNSGTVEITNSTIANNTGGLAAGGLINSNDITNAANAKVTGSIIANNNLTSTPIGDVSGDGEFISGGNNLISNGDDATGFIESDIVGTDAQPIDPNLGELQNNGGSTPTQELLAGSPAIDAGSNPDNLTTDQRGEGFDRTVGDGTDIGAFEVQNIDTNPGGGGGKPHPSTMPTSGDDTLLGTPCNDNIDGLEGNDILIGCNGNDTLSGGLGHDSLQGDDGRDTFVLASGFGTDTIVDFDCGNDLIGLSSEISFADLSFSGNNIILGTETIATLNGFDTANLTESNFVEV
jgi:uncharacterized protein YndB with AHSA1/START domain